MKNAAILVFILLFSACLPLQAAEILVPSQYPTIQAGIDAANNGDTVIISPGVYHGTGNWDIYFKGKAITVQSVEPENPTVVEGTVIDCNELNSCPWGPCPFSHRGFSFHNGEDENSILNGITIINGYSHQGGGIQCFGSSPIIKNCIIRNCIDGGGIYCSQGKELPDGYSFKYSKIINCIIENNRSLSSSERRGGGIQCWQSSPDIVKCIIRNNYARFGGGIGCSDMSAPRMTSCIIQGNRADYGGGISYDYGPGSSSKIINSLIACNTAKFDGGGILSSVDRLNIQNSTICFNSAGRSGGGMWPNFDHTELMGNIIWTNLEQPEFYPLMNVSFNCIDPNIFSDLQNGNIIDNPKFVRTPNDGGDGWGDDQATKDIDESANDDYGDLHLQKDSPCINAGLLNFFGGSLTDPDGRPRVIGGRIDIGAYEYSTFVNVTSPKGGEVWADESKQKIEWDSFGINGTAKILFSTNAGTLRKQIGTADFSAGSFDWNIPSRIDSNQCKISVVPVIADSNLIKIDSGIFEINKYREFNGRLPEQKDRYRIGPKSACPKWQFTTAGPVTAEITTHIDNLYVPCEDGKLYVLNENQGKLQWVYDAHSALTAPAISIPHGMIYAGDSQGKIHALNRQGELQWIFETYGRINSMPQVARNGNIFVSSEDGTLYALDKNGSQLWCFDTSAGKLNGAILATPQLADNDKTIYLTSLYDPNLYAINTKNGAVKWTHKFKDGSFVPPVIADDGILYYRGIYDPNLYAIEPENGEIIWSLNLADPCSGLFEPYTWKDYYGNTHTSFEYLKFSCGWSQPVVAPDETIYVNVTGPYLAAVYPDGTIKWIKKIGALGGFTLTVDKKGLIYAASDDKHLYILNPKGDIISEFEGNGQLSWPLINENRTVIVGDSNDTVWALNEDSCKGKKK